jgi:methionyl aminopeptidase
MTQQQTDHKIEAMREGGKVLSETLKELLEFAKPGVTLLAIEALAQKRIKEAGMKPSFSTVADYKWATCLCVNDVIVHGIPTSYELKDGDILTIDVGLINKKYHTDTAWTKVVGSIQNATENEQIATFLEVGKEALEKAIIQAKAGNRVGHISRTIQEIVEGSGYGIAKSLVGHGVGTTLHEPPQIPGFLKGNIEKTPLLERGMTIAIEVIYTMGNPTMYYHEDGWSIATRDHSPAAVFEQTLAVTDGMPDILTPAPIVM